MIFRITFKYFLTFVSDYPISNLWDNHNYEYNFDEGLPILSTDLSILLHYLNPIVTKKGLNENDRRFYHLLFSGFELHNENDRRFYTV